MVECKVYLAPIQGITDFVFRNHFLKHFSGIDKVFTPFFRYNSGFDIKKSQIADIHPSNNQIEFVVPQVLSNKASEILYFSEYVKEFGYSEINWNLGCPFPMVAKRQMGSGILPFSNLINEILAQVFEKIQLKLSIKMRLGYISKEEIFPVLSVLNNYPVSEIIIHPRVGKQMYKGTVDLDCFAECLKISSRKTGYNGDINDFNDCSNFKGRFSEIDTLMLGRGLIANPFLVEEIKNGKISESNDKLERFNLFYNDLYESYSKNLSGPGHLLAKMQELWQYFSLSFDDPHKVFKMIKKANTLDKYKESIYEIFNAKAYLAL